MGAPHLTHQHLIRFQHITSLHHIPQVVPGERSESGVRQADGLGRGVGQDDGWQPFLTSPHSSYPTSPFLTLPHLTSPHPLTPPLPTSPHPRRQVSNNATIFRLSGDLKLSLPLYKTFPSLSPKWRTLIEAEDRWSTFSSPGSHKTSLSPGSIPRPSS